MPTKVQVTDAETGKTVWWWRHRVGLTPIYITITATALGLASHAISILQTTVIGLVLGALAMIAAQSRWGRKKDRGQRNLVWATVLASFTYLMLIRTGVLSLGWTLVGLAVAVAVLGGFWWFDNVNIHRVKVERETLERWPVFAKNHGMPTVHRTAGRKTETGRRWTLWWEPGTTNRKVVMSHADDLESYLKVAAGKLQFEDRYLDEDGIKVDPNALDMVENTDSVINKQPVTFDGPTMRSIKDPMYIGPRENNTRHEVTWYSDKAGGMHTLAGGATGSGKSGLFSLTFAESAYCADVVRWGIDAKGGMELRPWAPLFDWIITDAEMAIYMLSAVKQVLIARSKYAGERGWKNWKASPEHPVLIVVVDEAAEVFGLAAWELNELSASVARMGRAAGVLFLIATQHPTNEALGSTQFTKNLRRRFCFSVEDDAGQRAILPNSSGKVDATAIPIHEDFAGTYYSSEGGLLCEKSARVRWVSDEDIYLLMLEIGAPGSKVGVVDLDELSQKAALRGSTAVVPDEDGEDTERCFYADRYIWTIKDLIPPEGWTGITPEQVLTGAAPAPAHAPSGAPLPDLSPTVPGAPADQQTSGASDGAPGEPVIPFPEGPDPMDVSDVVRPATTTEADELARARAEYEADHTDSPISPTEAERLLDELLDAAPATGTTINEMRKTLRRSASWYSDKLAARIVGGKLKKLDRGFYVRPGKARPPLRVVNDGDS